MAFYCPSQAELAVLPSLTCFFFQTLQCGLWSQQPLSNSSSGTIKNLKLFHCFSGLTKHFSVSPVHFHQIVSCFGKLGLILTWLWLAFHPKVNVQTGVNSSGVLPTNSRGTCILWLDLLWTACFRPYLRGKNNKLQLIWNISHHLQLA